MPTKSSKHRPRLKKSEFVTLMALMSSLVALAIDGMLPAFPQIGQALNAQSPDQLQLIVAVLFLGLGFGQLVFGPLSDVFGRKPPIYFSVAIFMAGAVLSGFAPNFKLFLLGRFMQGFGGAGPRVVSVALIRDEYSGNAMAQITSLVLTIFILVPAIAPTLGQGIMLFASWRAIFIVLFLMGLLIWIWFGLRQAETLSPSARKKFEFSEFIKAAKITFTQPTAVVCMIVSGLVFGIFVGYLGAVQDIFSSIFNDGDHFPAYFAMLALTIGAASIFNARFVMALGMRRLIFTSFLTMAVSSNLFVLYLTTLQVGTPPLWLFMIYMMLTFFCVGFLFGNLNAMAMEPLGHVAGMASSLLGFSQSTISVIVGVWLGQYFHGSVVPLVISFGTVSLLCIFLLSFEKKFKKVV